MTKTFKKIAASVMAATTLAVGAAAGMSVSAANRYSTIEPYKSGSYVYFGAYATNGTNNSTDFDYAGQLYNNTSGSFINSVTDRITNVGNGVQVTLLGRYSYSSLPDNTRCQNVVRSYVVYSQYATPYDTYTNNTYYRK